MRKIGKAVNVIFEADGYSNVMIDREPKHNYSLKKLREVKPKEEFHMFLKYKFDLKFIYKLIKSEPLENGFVKIEAWKNTA